MTKKQDCCQSSRQISEDRGKIASFIVLCGVRQEFPFGSYVEDTVEVLPVMPSLWVAKSWTTEQLNISLFTLYILEMKQKHEMRSVAPLDPLQKIKPTIQHFSHQQSPFLCRSGKLRNEYQCQLKQYHKLSKCLDTFIYIFFFLSICYPVKWLKFW